MGGEQRACLETAPPPGADSMQLPSARCVTAYLSLRTIAGKQACQGEET